MATFLFDELIFGPVKSRRLGNSLGINLLPVDCKVCNFNCIYCECGWSYQPKEIRLPDQMEVETALDIKLNELLKDQEPVDTITFAGNGEPTLHPQFSAIIDITHRLRNKYFPKAKVAVLSNATLLDDDDVIKALKKVELNILKLDSAFEETVKLLNDPPEHFSLKKLIKNLEKFDGNFVLQTMFVKGIYRGDVIDNTTSEEVEAWLNIVSDLHPSMVMIYTISRDTPIGTLSAIPEPKLNEIADKIREKGIEVMVSK